MRGERNNNLLYSKSSKVKRSPQERNKLVDPGQVGPRLQVLKAILAFIGNLEGDMQNMLLSDAPKILEGQSNKNLSKISYLELSSKIYDYVEPFLQSDIRKELFQRLSKATTGGGAADTGYYNPVKIIVALNIWEAELKKEKRRLNKLNKTR